MSSFYPHRFDQGNPLAQKKILYATIFTALMMFIEIIAGIWFNSMALLADGLHMTSHMLALGLAYIAYRAARYYADDLRFTFGTWKIEILAGFSSSIILMGFAILMIVSSVERLFNPVDIYYNEAILVAIIGLLVNIICAWLLHDKTHEHHQHHEHHHDLNQRAAFMHVIADAATSILAIIALFSGKYLGWAFADALLGIAGAILICKWAYSLIKQTGKILLDIEDQELIIQEIKQALNTSFRENVQITDFHIWLVGKNIFSLILVLSTQDKSITAETIKKILPTYTEIAHINVEVNYQNLHQAKEIIEA